MNDGKTLLAAILDEPGDDLPRLAYADWLEEQASAAEHELSVILADRDALTAGCLCGYCVKRRGGGQHHNGRCAADQRPLAVKLRERTISALVAGRERGEFIRVQLALAAMSERDCGGYYCDVDADTGAMIHRPGCRWTKLREREHELKGCDSFPSWCPGVITDTVNQSVYHRGFVESVTCLCQCWLDHAGEIMAAQPVQQVNLSDKEPWTPDEVQHYWFGTHSLAEDPWTLPLVLYDLLSESDKEYQRTPDAGKRYRSRQAATDALLSACLIYGKKPIPLASSR